MCFETERYNKFRAILFSANFILTKNSVLQIGIDLIDLHPWAGEDLSLKIDEHDQTIWNCILES